VRLDSSTHLIRARVCPLNPGVTFIKSKEMSNVSHTSEVIFELVDKAIQDLGPDSVMQVVMDNASNNMGAKTLLHDKRPNIFFGVLVQLTQ
jgi:type III secretory pathway lipoprotein EscJ